VSREQLDFAAFYAAARDDCLRTVLVSVGDMEAAQDLVAEAFARAWASWRKVSRHPAPRAWVVRTALNAGVSSWRKRRLEQPLRAGDGAPGTADVPGADVLADPIGRELMAALLRLPVRQRQVIALRIFLDLDTARDSHSYGQGQSSAGASIGFAT